MMNTTRITAINCLAKALYDNIAEAPDELAFRKGDILTVLEQNTNCMEGWWLCSLRGRQGIVPGNRLRLLPGMYDPSGLGNAGLQDDVSSHALRRSWSSNANKVITPQKVGAVYLYDVPASSKTPEKGNTPRTSVSFRYQGGSYDTPPSPRAVQGSSAYDEPKSLPLCHSPLPPSATYDSPRTAALVSDGLQHDYDTPSESNAYDVPRSADKDMGSEVSHIITITDNYDTPQPSLHKSSPPIYDGRAFSRSSGDTSTSSSFRSPSGSHSSIETLSLSSVGGSNRSSLEQHPNELYDIPPEPQPVIDPKTGGPRLCTSAVPYLNAPNGQETYDVPTNNSPAQFQVTRGSGPPEGAYDVPPQAMRDHSPLPRTDLIDSMPNFSSPLDLCDIKGHEMLPDCAELPLELSAAVEMLVIYHHEVQGAISKLFGFVSMTWRTAENMETKITDIEAACRKIQSSLLDFLNFAQGALANSIHADDKTLSTKLCKLVKPLRESCIVVKKCVQSLDTKCWTVQNLAQNADHSSPDELDQLVTCARGLVEDIRQIASFIQGNSALLFKSHSSLQESKTPRDPKSKPAIAPKPELKPKPSTPLKPGQKLQERPLPPTPAGMIKVQHGSKESEYDYVNLESKESVEKENEAIKASLPKDMCQSFDKLVLQSEIPVLNHQDDKNKKLNDDAILGLDHKDIQLLEFYGEQIDIHITHLTNAIDAFLLTIKNNQAPKVFVGHSKFIIISAHKLVFIGDTVHRNITNHELKLRVLQNSNNLCDSLKTLVGSTKKAASEFPSVAAVQEMVDSIVDVSHLANNLKLSIAKPGKA